MTRDDEIAALQPHLALLKAMGSPVFHPFRRVTLRIGDPIPTDGLTTRDRAELTEAVREQIVAMLATPTETSPKPGFQGARA